MKALAPPAGLSRSGHGGYATPGGPDTSGLGQDDDEAYSPECSWQKPYPTQERERSDRSRRVGTKSEIDTH